jgi:hypothetical protein
MAESAWKVRIMLFVRAVDNTPDNRQAFGEIFANNGSGESVENESGLFNTVYRLSVSGAAPAQVFGLETALLLPDMRTDMQAFLDTLTLSRYYVTANYDLPNGAFTGQLLQDNKVDVGQDTLVGLPPWDTMPFSMLDALSDLFDERGLQVISS